MIDSPYDYCHPSFTDQRQYALERAVVDTGDGRTDSTVTLTFRHSATGNRRRFHFVGVAFVYGSISMLTQIRGYLPVYVSSLDGRQLDGYARIEVGDTDPKEEWFWAESVSELE